MDADDVALSDRLQIQVEETNKLLEMIEANKSLGWRLGAVGTHAYYCDGNERRLGQMKTGALSFSDFDEKHRSKEATVITDPSSLISKSFS